ncbi:SRPBCC family protein [Phenylobacterium sp.]|uniref:SRPBCC family protein n=1 Tax=Phenylobacterium sp. TaxID=1871053 RepID=UPI0025CEC20B|nr:SRPBCC family protein [Phenylobacterium sp.]
MKITASLAAAAAVLGLAGSAHAAGDYVSIVQETTIALPADAAWAKLNKYCDIGPWLKTTCEITSGKDGELGAVRKIAGRIEEVIVAVTPMSYSYADVDPKIFYHGTVEIRPVTKTSSKLVYSLFFDQTSIPAEQREANKTRRQQMFAGVMATMKAQAEKK